MKIENFKNPPKLFPLAYGDGWDENHLFGILS
jgi:hypothetical protein